LQINFSPCLAAIPENALQLIVLVFYEISKANPFLLPLLIKSFVLKSKTKVPTGFFNNGSETKVAVSYPAGIY
jgi:hypothetical protein